MSVAQKFFYGEFMSPATIKLIWVFMRSAREFCPILTKSGSFSTNFYERFGIKLRGNQSRPNRTDASGQT